MKRNFLGGSNPIIGPMVGVYEASAGAQSSPSYSISDTSLDGEGTMPVTINF